MSDCDKVDVNLNENVSMSFCEVPPVDSTSSSFMLSQFEFTQSQYEAVTGRSNWGDEAQWYNIGANIPVHYINRGDIQMIIRLLEFMDPNATYRLPTKKEWVHAAKGGTNYEKYYWGTDFDPSYVFFQETTQRGTPGFHAVAYLSSDVTACPNSSLDAKDPGYCANAYGLMHMIGNVAELLEDGHPSNNTYQAAGGHFDKYYLEDYEFLSIKDITFNRSDDDSRQNKIGFRLIRELK